LAIPKSFLSDRPIFDANGGDAFLTEVTDDPREQTALLALHPRSGATLPIISRDGMRRGVIVACSREGKADSASFDALDRFAQIVAQRCYELESDTRALPVYAQDGLWKRFSDRALDLAVYRSNDCPTPWRYRMLGSGRGVLVLGLHDDAPLLRRLGQADCVSAQTVADTLWECRVGDPCFVAAIDFDAQSVSYAGRGFSPPIPLSASGPSGAVGTSRTLTAGVSTLAPSQRALICDDGLCRWLHDRQPSVGNLAMVLQDEQPPGLASIVTMGYPAR